MSAFVADGNRIKLIHRGLEPVVSWKGIKNIKQNRGSNRYSGQTGSAFPIGIPNPDPNGKSRRSSNGPSITKTKTGTGLPGDFTA